MMRFFDYPHPQAAPGSFMNHMMFHDDDLGFDENAWPGAHGDEWEAGDLGPVAPPPPHVADIGPGPRGMAAMGPGAAAARGMSRRARQSLNLMKTDWVDTPNSHVLHIDLPGVKREHVKVSLEDRHLRVHGERPKPNDAEPTGMTWRRMERPKGRFNRRYPMPDLDALDVDGIAARLEDGVLTVTIPLKQRAEEKVNVKNIEISI